MLFKRNQDIYKNAFPNWQKVGKGYDEYFILYADHYKEAGDKLILSIGDNHGHIADSIINPTIYLYRHCIELCLKAILLRNYLDCGINKEKIKEKLFGHNLDSLWNKVSNEMLANYNFFTRKKDKDEFKQIRQLINELHRTDNLSMNYRYPLDTDLREFIYGDGTESYGVDFTHLKEKVNYVYDRLYYWIFYNISGEGH